MGGEGNGAAANGNVVSGGAVGLKADGLVSRKGDTCGETNSKQTGLEEKMDDGSKGLIGRFSRWIGIDSPRGRAILTVKVCVFMDMFSVGLFVPLLPYYWKELGVRTEFLGLITSTYQISQIASGVVMGYVSDHIFGAKNVLLISFIGSFLSYTLAGLSFQNSIIATLVLSRVIVGLVKQTMTISRAITTGLTTKEGGERTTMLSHIRACSTFAFMIAPTLGGLLAKHFNMATPAYLAGFLFLPNAAMVYMFLPGKGGGVALSEKETHKKAVQRSESTVDSIANLLSRKGLGQLTCIKFMYNVFGSALFALGSRYVADKYTLEPHHMGYLSSYQSVISLISQMFLVGDVSKRLGEERTLHIAFTASVALSVVEGCNSSVYVYVALVPFRTLAMSLISQMFESLFILIMPDSEAASMLGTLGLLKAVARVTGPLYGGLLLGHLSAMFGHNARPIVEGAHDLLILLALLCYFPLHARRSATTASAANKCAEAEAESAAASDKKKD